MNNFDKTFGKLLQGNSEAEQFVNSQKINLFFDELWEDPDINNLTIQQSDYIRARLGRMAELMPPMFTSKALQLRSMIAAIEKTHICAVTEKHITTHIWTIYREAKLLLGENVYLNFVQYALREGVTIENEQVVENAKRIIADISFEFETAVIRYLIEPYCDLGNPKKAPQELIDFLRKLMIEDYKFAKKVLEDYEKGRIFIGK